MARNLSAPIIHFHRLGRLFKRKIFYRERTPGWAVALALLLYHLGLSLRKTAALLAAFEVEVSHVAVWYWIQKLGERGRLGVRKGRDPLPPRIVIDETWVQVGSRHAWIFTAIDPKSWKILYVEPFFSRNEQTTLEFLEHLAQLYGAWPQEIISDGGGWYKAVLPWLGWKKKFEWQVVRGGVRSAIEGFFGEFLKRRLKDLDCYCPSPKLERLRNWLWAYAWLHNRISQGGIILA